MSRTPEIRSPGTVLTAGLVVGALAAGWLATPPSARAQQPEAEPLPAAYYSIFFPNGAGKSLATPVAWGASGGVVFAGGGITAPQAYSDDSDGSAALGIGLGDPMGLVGVQWGTAMNDLSEQDNFSHSAMVHRYLGGGFAVAVGGEHLFPEGESDSGESFYVVVSHAFQGVASTTPGISRLHASVGVGSGRFGEKSPRDVAAGKGEDGTHVFANVAWEVFRNVNLVADWNGTNLAAGAALTPIPALPVGMTLGFADLTDNSGDGARFVISGGFGVPLPWRR